MTLALEGGWEALEPLSEPTMCFSYTSVSLILEKLSHLLSVHLACYRHSWTLPLPWVPQGLKLEGC